MINIIVIAHSEIANSFAHCAEHILARRVDRLHILPVKKTEAAEVTLQRARELISKFSNSNGVLILTDLFGATPTNIAQQLVEKGKIELITGLNLPMLIRAISYVKNDLAVAVTKTLDGAKSGIIYIAE